jgi:hypothetical protein
MMKRLKRIKGRFEALSMAVTFAEAGEWHTAERILDEFKTLNENRRPKMLFITAADGFSDGSIDYVVNLAGRLKLDILAMNVQPVKPLKRFVHALRRGRWDRQSQRTLYSLEKLRTKAWACGIHCDYTFWFEDLVMAVRKICRLIRRIELVMVQTSHDERLALDFGVPVFRVVSEEVEQHRSRVI